MKSKLTMLMFIAGFLCAEAQEWQWSEDQLSIAREGISATALEDTIFFSQGRKFDYSFTNVVDVYDVGEDVWDNAILQSTPRCNTVSVTCNGKVFIAGGHTYPGGTCLDDVDIYEKATGEWTVKHLSQARTLHGAAAQMNKVFFAGGYLGDPSIVFYDIIDVYNTVTDTWDTPLFLTEPKAAIGVTAAGGKVFFAGGIPALGVETNVVEIYDIGSDSWTYTTLSQARSFPAAIAYGNKVYFAGGALQNALSSDVVDIYNLDSEAWDPVQNLYSPRIVHALKVKDALVFTGETDFISASGEWGPANGITDIYYPETGQWDYEATELEPARIWYACTAYDDKAYFGGGWPGGGFVSDLVSILEYTLCFSDDVTFTTQEEIDNFSNNNPYCSQTGGDVEIDGDDIINLDGLSQLVSIGGYLDISDSPNLTSLTGLSNLTSISGKLVIKNNESLTSLLGLENISPGSITNLEIWNNPLLSACHVACVCDFLESGNPNFEIYSNADNCNSKEEIEVACENPITDIQEINEIGMLSTIPNPIESITQIQYTLRQNSHVSIKIVDVSGREISTLIEEVQQQGVQKFVFNSLGLKPGIYFYVLKTNKGIQTKKIIKL